ncbi:MAG: hypothetical protein K5644_05105 [Lachnospiraceae bacterium]|nr:hypothetical protein [Lachnospiraceae bacterium]
MKNKKILVAVLCITCLVFGLCGCGKSDETTTNTTATNNKKTYNIGICVGANNEYYNQILAGFTTAVNDNFKDSNAVMTSLVADENNSSDMICDQFVQNKNQLMFTIGENAMLSAHSRTKDIPIVSSAIMDFQRALNLPDDKDWDGTTKTNITGVSSAPNMSDVLSMMIEATPELSSVGILFCPENADSIYQNKLLEKYLDQAGIPWKEYAFYSPSISDDSAREIVKFACSESSVLYIPAESALMDKMGLIKSVAMSSNIPTIGGDEYIGEYTLCSMYHDPFDQGYAAGEMAYDILESGKKPQSMSIAECSTTAEQKLYTSDYADALGRTFPKSFRERTEFLTTYVLGSKTTRNNVEK